MTMSQGPVILLAIFLLFNATNGDTRYFAKVKNDDKTTVPPETPITSQKSRAIFRLDDESMIHDTLKANHERRNSFVETSTFDPDVLNKFLDEYANKIKSTTERSGYSYPYRVTTKKPTAVAPTETDSQDIVGISTTSEDSVTIHGPDLPFDNLEAINDTSKRNKFHHLNSNDDRDGWVSLEAIPWSKSKISKWQANPSSQRPWPDNKWDKPNEVKPWQSDYPSRPQYESNKPWYEKPKPSRPDSPSDRLTTSRPTFSNDRYESNMNQAQKWPPERPQSSWDNFSDGYRPNSDIITDDRPSNFPTSNWDKYDQVPRPTYSSHSDKYANNQHTEATNDWPSINYPHSNPNKFDSIKDKPFSRPPYPTNQRPYFSGQYEYESHHPPSHPSSGDGQWILLSTNRGYSKTRQRALKIETMNDGTVKVTNGTSRLTKAEDSVIPVMTSKRQVRLTVLPSVNGTNTTTSHGGLLEVEKSFKTVDESQKEYAQLQLSQNSTVKRKILKKRPLRHTVSNRPSNSAVIAAVSAGMLPATMAVVLPMMLGRKKRSPMMTLTDSYSPHKVVILPANLPKRRI